MQMTSSDLAAWVGAIGTILAAGIAVWLYWKSRQDAKTDIAARRRVLHAVLRQHVLSAGKFVQAATERLRKKDGIDDDWRLLLVTLELDDAGRLSELQSKLMEFGEEGDAEIAAFIEACRQYDVAYRGWRRYAGDRKLPQMVEGDPIPLAIQAMTHAVERVAVTVAPALAAIGRFDAKHKRLPAAR